MNKPFNITISVPSGNPDKLRVIEKTNRLSLALVFNRSELSSVAKSRSELEYTGVYMLVNSSSDSLPEIYIGEGESVLDRLKKHNKDQKKDFWEWAVVFVNRDNSLHKAHIQHIEAALVERANTNKRCICVNDVSPRTPSLPESVLYEAEDLLSDIYHIVPLLGISAFEEITQDHLLEPEDILSIRTKGITATGFSADGKFVVQSGSGVIPQTVPSISSGFSGLRDTLVDQGVIDTQNNQWSFTQDYTFASPSTAAAVVMGRNANGRTEWKTAQGRTFKQIQEESMD